MSDEDLGFIPDDHAALGFVPDESHPILDAGKTALRAIGKVASIPMGYNSLYLNAVAEALGHKPLLSDDEKLSAINPTLEQPPGAGELLKRLGVPGGPNMTSLPKPKWMQKVMDSVYAKPGTSHRNWQPEVGGMLDPKLRDVGGLALDMVRDPLGHGLGAESEIANGILHPVSTAADRAGVALYESGIKPIIQEAAHHGNPNVGKTMLKHGISGTPPQIKQGRILEAAKVLAARDADIAAGEKLGAMASKDAAYSDILDDLTHKATRADLGGSQRLSPDDAYKIFQDATEVQQAGPNSVAPSIMSQWKTDVRSGLPGSTFSELAKTKPDLADRAVEAVGGGYQKEVERSLSRASPGLGASVAAKNKELGDLINKHANAAASKMADTYEKTPWFSKSDFILGGLGYTTGGMAGHAASAGGTVVAAKKALDALRSTRFKTTAGKGMKRFSETPLLADPVDAAARQLLIRQSPYATERK